MFSQTQYKTLPLAFLLGGLGTVAGAQSAVSSVVHDPMPLVVAARVSTSSIRIDGALTESLWRSVRPATVFTQSEPTQGAPATRATDVRMIITDDAVVIGARLSDDPNVFAKGNSAPGMPNALHDDYFEVQLDAHMNHLTALAFAVSPAGDKQSWMVAHDGSRDKSWNVHWDAATHLDRDGWTLEIRIPRSELQVQPGDENWGVQFVRFSYARQETDVLSRSPTRSTAMGDR